jgi:hypothetical protein
MTIETMAFLVAVFAATAVTAMAYERRMDVLYGPYVDGRAGRTRLLADLLADRFWKPVDSAVDRLRWKARNLVYLTSLIAC